jgi:predicted ATPase
MDLWLLGYVPEAHAQMTEALDLAHELAQPFSLAYALSWSMWLAVLEDDVQGAAERSDAGIALCREHGMDVWLGGLSVGRGWALAERGEAQAGISLMHGGIAMHRATGNVFQLPFYMGLVAGQYARIAQTDQGLTLVSEALAAVERTGERWCEAEWYRWRGVLLGRRGDAVEADLAYQQALDLARAQQARGLELRATSSLSVSYEHRRVL